MRPLGLGSIQSLVDPIVSSWRPTAASGRPKAARYAVTPSTASHRGRRASTRLRSSGPPSTNSAWASSATPTVGRGRGWSGRFPGPAARALRAGPDGEAWTPTHTAPATSDRSASRTARGPRRGKPGVGAAEQHHQIVGDHVGEAHPPSGFQLRRGEPLATGRYRLARHHPHLPPEYSPCQHCLTKRSDRAAVNAASRRTRQRETNPAGTGASSRVPIRSAANFDPDHVGAGTVHLVSSPTVTNEMHQVWPRPQPGPQRIGQATAQAGGGDVGIEDDEAHARSARRDAYRSATNSFHS